MSARPFVTKVSGSSHKSRCSSLPRKFQKYHLLRDEGVAEEHGAEGQRIGTMSQMHLRTSNNSPQSDARGRRGKSVLKPPGLTHINHYLFSTIPSVFSLHAGSLIHISQCENLLSTAMISFRVFGAFSPFAVLILISSLLISFTSAARVTNPSKVPKNAVLLSKISTLTLRSGRSTASHRVSPVAQLQCTGPPSVCSLYQVDVMRCKNEGADYDDNNIQWTCSASLPEEFRLGSTDVTCEGYESSDDPYVLKGSCGVGYRLLLTEKGEKKYDRTNDEDSWSSFRSKSRWDKLGTFIFWLVFGGVVSVMVLSAFGCLGRRGGAGAGGNRPGWGGDGGGSGSNDDPPPPYSDYRPLPKPSPRSSSSRSESWRPGVWTGAAAGAAAGYALGNRGRNQTGGGLFGGGAPSTNTGGPFGGRRHDPWEGNSGSSSTSPSYSSSRHESTGFGSTSRR
jgi:SOCE-associated regulatory factor of calcium homoeostasis